MLFNTVTVLALSASVIAHPYLKGDLQHSKHLNPSGSGNVIAPTGGKYGMRNCTSAHGPTSAVFATGGTGFSSPTVIVVTETSPESSSVATVVDPATDGSACATGSQLTTTVYKTEVVTMTVTGQNTITIATGSAGASVLPSSASSDTSVISAAGDNTSPAVIPVDSIPSAESSVDSIPSAESSVDSTPSAESSADSTTPTATSSADLNVSLAAPISSEQPAPPASPPTAVTTDAPVASPDAGYPSSPEIAPGGFYEASSAAPPVVSSVSTAGSYSGGKRGLAYNSAKLTNAFSGGSMSWAYNWANNPDGALAPGIEFVPMLWGPKMYSGWDAAAKSALAGGAKNLLSFNEPDLAAQANMDSATAAADHIKYMNPYAGQARIGSPAVTNGGPGGGTDGMGLGWLQNFFDKCAGRCKVDFLSFHWYDSANNVAYFKNYVQDVIAMAKKNGVNKVWLTEFAAAGSDAEVAKFLAEVLPWMDANDAVERYAYFMCQEGALVTGSSISDPVGKAYAA